MEDNRPIIGGGIPPTSSATVSGSADRLRKSSICSRVSITDLSATFMRHGLCWHGLNTRRCKSIMISRPLILWNDEDERAQELLDSPPLRIGFDESSCSSTNASSAHSISLTRGRGGVKLENLWKKKKPKINSVGWQHKGVGVQNVLWRIRCGERESCENMSSTVTMMCRERVSIWYIYGVSVEGTISWLISSWLISSWCPWLISSSLIRKRACQSHPAHSHPNRHRSSQRRWEFQLRHGNFGQDRHDQEIRLRRGWMLPEFWGGEEDAYGWRLEECV